MLFVNGQNSLKPICLLELTDGENKEQKLWISLDNSGTLTGSSSSNINDSPEFTIQLDEATITEVQDKNFKIVTKNYRLLFLFNDEKEQKSWISSVRKSKTNMIKQQEQKQKETTATTPQHSETVSFSTDISIVSKVINHKEENFTDPLRCDLSSFRLARTPSSSTTTPSSVVTTNYIDEWDREATSQSSPWIRNEDLDEKSAVSQLSKELCDAQAKIKKYEQRVSSYKEVLAVRDKQLFDAKDRLCDQEKEISANCDEFQIAKKQMKDLQMRNSLLNNEIQKINKELRKARSFASDQKRSAATINNDLLMYQRDYVDLLEQLVHQPLFDPIEGAVLRVVDSKRHVSAVNDLVRSMRTNKCLGHQPLPCIGNKEYVDAYSFKHHLPNEAIQLEYACRYLTHAFDVVLNEGGNSTANCTKWKELIAASSENFQVTTTLKKYVLQDEIPNQYRSYVWQKLIFQLVRDIRSDNKGGGGDGYGETFNYYQSKLDLKETLLEGDKAFAKNLKQIIMDVPRTMPRNHKFSTNETLRERLERVLTAFCIHAPDIGYCQGFNFLAGGALLFLDEEDAFWFLTSIVEVVFPPEYFLNDLAGLQADQQVLASIVADECPRLCAHLDRYATYFELSVVTTSWFLGLFFDCMTFETLVRVWDCLLVFGHEALFRISVAIFRIFEEQIIEITEPSQLLHAVKNLPRLCVRSDQLIHEAFEGLKKFPTWSKLMDDRRKKEFVLVEEYEVRLQQCKEYKEKIMKVSTKGNKDDNEKLIFDKSVSSYDRVLMCASCQLSESSQLYEIDAHTNTINDLALPLIHHVTCFILASSDVVVVGLFTGQLQAYSISRSFVRWSMSLSNVVLTVEMTAEHIFVGTADNMLHVLKKSEGMGKPTLVDTVELSSHPTCMCVNPSQSSLWVAAGSGIYVIDTETTETEGFFLISLHKDEISTMHHWNQPLSSDRHLVWIALQQSPVIQLLDACNYKAGPVLVFDISTSASLSLCQPMMKDDNKSHDESSPSTTVVNIVSSSETCSNQVWLSTSNGHIKRYQVEACTTDDHSGETDLDEARSDSQEGNEESTTVEEDNDIANKDAITNSPVLKIEADFTMNLVNDYKTSDRSTLCVMAHDGSVYSACGYYGEEESVKRWVLNENSGEHKVINIMPYEQTENDQHLDIDDENLHGEETRR